MNAGIRKLPLTLILLLLAAAGGLTIYNLTQQLPPAQWARALSAPDIDDVRQMLFHYSLLPRLTVSLLAGAGLGLVGVLFQQVLRNPLAEPSTLGVAAGAQLGLTIATLWVLPGGEFTRQLAAMVGAIAVGGLVFGVAWGKRMSPVTLILAGLVLGLYCGAVNSLLALFNYDQLQGMFLWGTGALNQQDWSAVQFILPRLLVAGALAALLLRPLTLLGLDDGVARNLGLGLSMARFCALGLAIIFSAMLVSAVGVIGFIGLFAPLMAKMLGARRLAHRMMLAPLLGALLLWLTDQVMIGVAQVWREIPTGAATALFGAPLLLWLLPRLRSAATPPPMNLGDKVPAERGNLPGWAALAGVVLLIGLTLALMLGKNAGGWHWSLGAELDALLPWRWPRVLSALAAGMMLAVAGTLIQKLTGNPMASPEMLGVSSGAALGGILVLVIVPGFNPWVLLAAAIAGALIALLAIVALSWRSAFAPDRMLLTGVALSTLLNAFAALFMVSGDSRVLLMLSWMTGSTYRIDAGQALVVSALAVLFLLVTPLCNRWLAIMPLGAERTRALGISLGGSRLVLLLLTAVMTAAATLAVGPLSFVGLIAPHIARMLGARRPIAQLLLSAMLGGTLLVLADWLGRNLVFPWQIPAGIFATFIGGPYFMWLLVRKR